MARNPADRSSQSERRDADDDQLKKTVDVRGFECVRPLRCGCCVRVRACYFCVDASATCEFFFFLVCGSTAQGIHDTHSVLCSRPPWAFDSMPLTEQLSSLSLWYVVWKTVLSDLA